MFDKVLVANRGEIAVRIFRTCREIGVRTVAVHSDVDAKSRHVALADEAVHLPGIAPDETYLDMQAIIEAARATGAEAIHPGYGFLSENADFAEAVVSSGLAWVGPPPQATRAVGDKIKARNLAVSAGVPVVPGLFEALSSHEEVLAFAKEHGYPVAIKASGGGGGRGLKVAHDESEVAEAFESARRESIAYFGSSDVYVERYLSAPKHLEVQILSPGVGAAMWLGVRDCSLQRRHQKLVEETPPPRFADGVEAMGEAAVALANACGYIGAGTVEMLADESGEFYFLEVNARLQVEHTVTEEITGLDLVANQLKIAAGDPLGFDQGDIRFVGHSIECRINAEDPARGFLPTPGRITRMSLPDGLGIRVDSGYIEGDVVPEAYDSLIAKLIVTGNDREEARGRMLRALKEFDVEGIETTIPAHLALLEHPDFVSGLHTTRTVETSGVLESLATSAEVEEDADVLLVRGRAVRLWNPAMAHSASAASRATGGTGEVVAPMQGTVLKVLARVGEVVEAGQPIAVVEAMKMETTLSASIGGTVSALNADPGQSVSAGEVIATIE